MNLYDIYDKIILKIFEFFPEKKAERIFHYTSESVLWEFLKAENDLYCTYCKSLSDPTEFLTGMCVVARMLRDHCGGNEDGFLQPIEAAYAMSGNEGKNFLPWIMSFSMSKDKTELWRKYTNVVAGGYSIGFCVDKIKACLSMSNNQSSDAWILISLLPCLYSGCDDQDKINALLEYVLDDISIDLKVLMDKRKRADDNEQMARALLYLLMASIIKHSDFSGEEEWRLVVQPIELTEVANHKLPGESDAFAMIGGKPRLRSRLFGSGITISSLIEEIVVSPHGPSDILQDRAQLFLALRGIDSSIVVKSVSPYRGE